MPGCNRVAGGSAAGLAVLRVQLVAPGNQLSVAAPKLSGDGARASAGDARQVALIDRAYALHDHRHRDVGIRQRVADQIAPPGGRLGQPLKLEILDDKGDNRLTLVACHPKYSARQRIIVTAQLVDEPAPMIVGQAELMDKAGKSSRQLEELTAEKPPHTPAVLAGLAVAALAAVAWSMSHLLWRRGCGLAVRAVPWLVCAAPLSFATWALFGRLVLLMPAR